MQPFCAIHSIRLHYFFKERVDLHFMSSHLVLSHFRSIRDILRYAISRFNAAQLYFGHGTQNAFDEASYLILHSLHLPLDQLDPFLDAQLLPSELENILQKIEQRCQQRIPLAYLTQEAWLMGYRFYVDERVIVPRSLLGRWIIEKFSPWLADDFSPNPILDLCTGSGCLAIMLADVFENALVDAVDISLDALKLAQKNVHDYQLSERVQLIQSDLFSQLPQKKYDLIISNPPYVNSTAMQNLPAEYLHEPQLALAGGQDGMDIVRKIIANAHEYLSDEGLLIIEIGNEYEYAQALLVNYEPIWLSSEAGDGMIFMLTAEQLQMR